MSIHYDPIEMRRAGEQDMMTLLAECTAPAGGLAEAVAATMRRSPSCAARSGWWSPGSLPNDGKVIVDDRVA